MKDNASAFPVFDTTRVNGDGTLCTDYGCSSSGMTLKQYAAIHLKVPRSGDPELDGMIRESVRRDFAGLAMAAMPVMLAAENEGVTVLPKGVVDVVFELVDAMFAAWEKEENRERV